MKVLTVLLYVSLFLFTNCIITTEKVSDSSAGVQTSSVSQSLNSSIQNNSSSLLSENSSESSISSEQISSVDLSSVIALSSSSSISEQLSSKIEMQPCSIVAKECINSENIVGNTFVFPENVTHIEKEGLLICEYNDSLNPKKQMAFLYIIDQSSSMRISGGDPHTIRGLAVVEAIERQKELLPHSAAGVIEFSGSLIGDSLFQKAILPLSDTTHYNDLINNISAKVSAGTNYIDALIRAEEYVSALSKNWEPIVLFITDGQPMGSNDPHEIINISNSFNELHTFFLGEDDNPGKDLLKEMSEPTGGAYHKINSNNPSELGDSINTLISIDHLIEYVNDTFIITASNQTDTLSESTQNYLLNDVSDTHTQWLISLPEPIQLATGENSIDYSIGDGVASNPEGSFIFNLEEGVYQTEIESEYWELICE